MAHGPGRQETTGRVWHRGGSNEVGVMLMGL